MTMEELRCQFVIRSVDGGTVVSDLSTFSESQSNPNIPKGTRQITYSKNGRFCGFCTDNDVIVFDTSSGKVVLRLVERKNLQELSFSPNGKFLSVFERFVKSADGTEPAHLNLVIYEVLTAKPLFKFTQKNQSNWAPQFTEDETTFARLVTNSVQFYDAEQPELGVKWVCSVDNVQSFSLGPGQHPNLAVFAGERKGQPAVVAVYKVPIFETPAAKKSFFQCDFVQFSWNTLGTSVLALATSDIDTTGKSYYGQSTLYLLNAATKSDCKVALSKPGPIHDLAWNPNPKAANEFIVVYGSMPSHVTMFDHRANPKAEIAKGMRNFVAFNPQGRLFCVAGFGNLAGEIDFYDRESLKPVGTCIATHSSVCMWSPCGRFVLTGTVTPRLRVDNGYKVWHHSGALMFSKDVKEMYSIQFKPFPFSDIKWPDKRALSPSPPQAISGPSSASTSPINAAVKPIGKYIPPSARNGSSGTFNHRDPGAGTSKSVPGSTGQVPGAPKNAKAAGKSKDTSSAKANSALKSLSAAESQQEPSEDSAKVKNFRKLMKLKKKLAQINDLKKKQANNEPLEKTQIEKINSELAVLAELQELGKLPE